MKSIRTLLLPEALLFTGVAISRTTAAGGLVVALTGLTLLQRQGEKYLAKHRQRHEVSGLQSEEVLEEPPADLEYDDRDPCTLPSVLDEPGFEAAGEAGECVPPKDFEAAGSAVPFAKGGDDPLWPIVTSNPKKVRVSYRDVRNKFHGKWGRHFGTLRKGTKGVRRHAGIDLFANVGDTVQAMEDGQVLATLPFTDGTWALYVLNHSGDIINYGELAKGSWRKFGIRGGIGTGQQVLKGEPLGKVGDTAMLHLETLRGDTSTDQIRRGDMQWYKGDAAPPQVLDPSQYLVRAQRGWFERKLSDEIEPGPAES